VVVVAVLAHRKEMKARKGAWIGVVERWPYKWNRCSHNKTPEKWAHIEEMLENKLEKDE
jgi:hypothetical protein